MYQLITNKTLRKEEYTMLINCPECELQLSDKAIICPHCGFPLKPNMTPRITRVTNRRKRLPNGFGQISEIKGRNLRKPFRAMITVGKNSKGKPICKPLKPESFFETYNDAYMALVEYQKNPYDLEPDITVKQLYDRWSEEYFKTLKSDSSMRTVMSAWDYCSSIESMRVTDLRARHIKGVMDNGIAVRKGKEYTPSANIKSRIKSLFNLMLDYAVEYEIVDRNYARTFNISDDVLQEKEETKRGHMPLTDDEIQLLWVNVDKIQYVDIVLIQCYSGWRPQELGLIELERVDMENWVFTGGLKTDAGIDRLVPIHSKVRHLVKRKYDEAIELGSQYLFNCTDVKTHKNSLKLTYDKYYHRFNKILNALDMNLEHRPHDPRMHFVTQAKKYEVDEYALKYMVGHKIEDITERVYTQREVEWLQKEIEKIK